MGVDETISLPDGRVLAYAEYGNVSGPPLFVFHGTPGSRLEHDPFDRPVDARIISPDRPGYGRSDRREGRRLVDWPADVACVADALELDQFSVLGISGGGPHALACAALLPGRVERVATVCGAGPMDRPDAADGMDTMNAMMLEASRTNPEAMFQIGEVMAAAMRTDPAGFLDQFATSVPAPDQATMAKPEVRAMALTSMAEALRQGGAAMAEEMLMFVQPWGFDLTSITQQVHLWQGDQDTNVPPAHARLLAESLPNATLHMVPGEGHLSLAIERAPEFIAALLA